MEVTYGQQPSSRRFVGFAAVVVLHIFIFYALVSGLARNVVEIVKKPLETKIIVELPPPPPPPPKEIVKPPPAPKVEAPPPPYVPPPEITPPPSVAPPITTVAEPPKVEYKIEPPPPPPAPPAPPAQPAGPVNIGVVCPTQVKPEIPRKALQEGTSGVVRAQAKISGGVVKDVTILSGPRVFHAPVKAAMLQYKCQSTAEDVIATQDFEFKVE